MSEELKSELITREVMDRLEELDIFCDFTELNGEPFCIVEGWGELSNLNKVLNEIHRPELWAQWEPVYREKYDRKLAEERERWGEGFRRWGEIHPNIYGSLRIPTGVNRDGEPGAPYLVPEGLIELDQVMEWGFSDEYSTCSDCYKAVRTSPDSYSWQMRGYIDEDGIHCRECTKDDPDLYLEHCMNSNSLLNEDLIDLVEEGWTDLELRMENGFHRGQNDDPRLILEVRERLFPFIDIVFTGSVGQFDIAFTAWVRPGENAEEDQGGWVNNPDALARFVGMMLRKEYKTPASGPSDHLKAALKGASEQMQRIPV